MVSTAVDGAQAACPAGTAYSSLTGGNVVVSVTRCAHQGPTTAAMVGRVLAGSLIEAAAPTLSAASPRWVAPSS